MAREIEVKLLVDGATYEETVEAMTNTLINNMTGMLQGTSVDCYWAPPSGAEASIVRLRVSDTECSITVKSGKDITDRKEWVIDIPRDQKDDALEALNSVHGDSTPIIWRFVDYTVNNVVISIIQNLERREWTFVEVEGPDIVTVQAWADNLKKRLEPDLKQVKNSFYDIFVQKQGVML